MECIEFIQCACRAAAGIAIAAPLAAASLLAAAPTATNQPPVPTSVWSRAAAAPTASNQPPALTSSWNHLWIRDIPLKASNAFPFVAAADPYERLWLADQREGIVNVYSKQGLRRDSVRAPRGTVVAIYFDDEGGQALVASQRGEMRWPLGDYYLFSMDRQSGRDITKTRNRTYPKYWTGRSAEDELELSRRRGEFTEVTSPSNIVRWTLVLSPHGSVVMVLPVFSIIERHGADGKTVSDSLAESLRPWSPCWLLATRNDQFLIGDTLGKRIVLAEPAMKPRMAWPRENVAGLVPAPRPDTGWLLLDPTARTIELAGAGGRAEGTWRLPPGQWLAALMPRRNTLWLFESTTWTWHAYDRAK